jgi:cysteine desulfurase
MGASPEEAGAAIRVSLGWASTAEDVDALLAAWGELCRRSRAA